MERFHKILVSKNEKLPTGDRFTGHIRESIGRQAINHERFASKVSLL
jgi:hypothetical protein